MYDDSFDNNYNACARYIDWERGTPYVFRKEDFDDLASSKCLYARKFDEGKDREIIEMIYDTLIERER